MNKKFLKKPIPLKKCSGLEVEAMYYPNRQ